MNRHTVARSAIVVALALASSACSEQVQQAADQARQGIEAATAEVGAAADSIAAARQKLYEGNLTLGGGELPKVEITPQGDWLVNGLPLPLTDAQRTAVQNFRSETLKVADAGMRMSQDGIAFTGLAVSTKVAGILSGNTDAAIARIEAGSKNMETVALALCEQMKGLQAAQTTLAALLPEFAPYAQPFETAIDCGEAAASPATVPAAPQ